MKRREFILVLGGAAVTWPLAARAQQPTQMRRIGVLMMYEESNASGQALVAAFRRELGTLGWMEGQNLRIEYRWTTSDPDLIQRSAKELVTLQPELILASSTPATAALQRETRTIPILFANIVDPIGSGFVTNLARPGGNITGFVNLAASITGKFLELLKQIAPRVTRVAIVFNPATAPYAEIYLDSFKAAAASLGVEPIVAPIHAIAELETVVAALGREPNGGLIAMPDGYMSAHPAEVTSLAARYRVPAVYYGRPFAVQGGLLSYGNDVLDNYRRAATYVDKILKGTKPNELPVQFPVKFELVINLKTAKALGLDVPVHLQQLADEVIE